MPQDILFANSQCRRCCLRTFPSFWRYNAYNAQRKVCPEISFSWCSITLCHSLFLGNGWTSRFLGNNQQNIRDTIRFWPHEVNNICNNVIIYVVFCLYLKNRIYCTRSFELEYFTQTTNMLFILLSYKIFSVAFQSQAFYCKSPVVIFLVIYFRSDVQIIKSNSSCLQK